MNISELNFKINKNNQKLNELYQKLTIKLMKAHLSVNNLKQDPEFSIKYKYNKANKI